MDSAVLPKAKINVRITAVIADDDHKFGIDNVAVRVQNVAERPEPRDTTPPVIKVPDSFSGTPRVEKLGYYAEFTVTATDDVDGAVDVKCSHKTGYFKAGVTTVTCTAKYKAGNKASASFTITMINSKADTDGDGYRDRVDLCPTVASSKNVKCSDITKSPRNHTATRVNGTVLEFYGGNEFGMIVKNSAGRYVSPGTMTIGATNSSGTSGIVTAGHNLEIVPGHNFEFVEHTIGETRTRITAETVPVFYENNTDVAFIPITEPNIIVGNKIQALNGTMIENVRFGNLTDMETGQMITIYGALNNGTNALLYKNATVSTKHAVLSNMGLGLYPSQ